MFFQLLVKFRFIIHLCSKGETFLNEISLNIQIIPQLYQEMIRRLLEILLPEETFHYLAPDQKEKHFLRVCLCKSEFAEYQPLITEITLLAGRERYCERVYHEEILDPRYEEFDYDRRGKDLLKNHLYTFLIRYLHKDKSPWGILTGIRPTKLVHYLRDKSFNYAEIKQIFRDVYAVSDDKIDLLTRIGQVEESYLPTKNDAPKRVSLYIGIPFCPSRCTYCSFPAFSLEKHNRFIEPFITALLHEVEAISKFISENNLLIDSIYFGGGTPTSLSPSQLEQVFANIAEQFSIKYLQEYNVEAGRPDTITQEKLELMKNYGVSRVSINPQTIHQKTLDLIGRRHSVEEFYQAFIWAKELNFENINTDLIIGLPGENYSDLKFSLKRILELQPDSVTIHTLALKKAASWWGSTQSLSFATDHDVRRIIEYIDHTMCEHQLFPYYMYRQKYILGNQENVGYAVSGKESLYNMIMIEERETVIGLGGGAVTKVVNSNDWSLSRYTNPKYPGDYITRIDEIIKNKIALLTDCHC